MYKPNFWKQTDKRWASLSYGGMTLGAGGCGPTTIANIVSALLNKNITPKKVWNYMVKHGYLVPGQGTLWAGITATLKHYGIEFKAVYSDADVRKSLEAGEWVLGLAGKSRWTTSGHYFSIYDLTATNHLLISDPYSSSDYCQKNGTLAEYLAANKCNWISIDPKKYPGYIKYKERTSKVFIMYCDNGSSNIRKGRNMHTGVVGKVTRGTKLYVCALQNGWYKIKKGKYKGYYIHEHQLTAFPPYVHTYKALTNMNVRKGPASNGDIIDRIKKGTKLVSSKVSGDWLYFPAVHGWIRRASHDKSTTYLKRTD